ncbi:MAG: hypothetical protein K5657_06730 [Desulfovibrio sp.]|nr:hypothetical protein [Desulfovibrio sp.]
MNKNIFFASLLFFFPALTIQGSAAEQPSVHNEYHNSTIYSGTTAVEKEEPSFPPEGIYTYDDPETGDHVISVRSRRSDPQQNNTPLLIKPIIRPF